MSATVNGLETLVTFLFALKAVVQIKTALAQECVSAVMDGLEIFAAMLFVLTTVVQMENVLVQECVSAMALVCSRWSYRTLRTNVT